jgi:predicted nucleotidyltransferase
MLNLTTAIPVIQQLYRNNPQIALAYLFGSYIDGFANPNSDLDLAILFKKELSLWEEMAIQAQLTEAIQFEKIDLINLNKAPLRMQFQIIASGQLIYENDPEATEDYLEQLLTRYHHQEIRYRQFYKDWDEGLKEDYIDGQS